MTVSEMWGGNGGEEIRRIAAVHTAEHQVQRPVAPTFGDPRQRLGRGPVVAAVEPQLPFRPGEAGQLSAPQVLQPRREVFKPWRIVWLL